MVVLVYPAQAPLATSSFFIHNRSYRNIYQAKFDTNIYIYKLFKILSKFDIIDIEKFILHRSVLSPDFQESKPSYRL